MYTYIYIYTNIYKFININKDIYKEKYNTRNRKIKFFIQNIYSATYMLFRINVYFYFISNYTLLICKNWFK